MPNPLPINSETDSLQAQIFYGGIHRPVCQVYLGIHTTLKALLCGHSDLILI